MQQKGWVFLKVLLNRYHPSDASALLQALTPMSREAVISQKTPSNSPEKALPDPFRSLEKVHYSWLSPLLQAYPSQLIPLLVGLLPLPHRQKLKISLNLSTVSTTPLAPVFRTVLLQKICDDLKHTDLLPYDFLPDSPLKPLGKWDKQELMDLINTLGIYDLVNEVRQVIDKATVQNIYHALNLMQAKFLRYCLHQKEKVSGPPLGIKNWDGDKKKLETLIQQRGIIRLGRSLHGEQTDLVWYITHALDIGRGMLLYKSYAAETSIISHALQQQTVAAMKFLTEQYEVSKGE